MHHLAHSRSALNGATGADGVIMAEAALIFLAS
jgi:hypothetical protein